MTIERLQASLNAALARPTITAQDVEAFRVAVNDGTAVTAAEVQALKDLAARNQDKFEPAASTGLEALLTSLAPLVVTPGPTPPPNGGTVVSWDSFAPATGRDGIQGTEQEEGLRTFDELAPALTDGTLTAAQQLLLASATARIGVMGEAEALRSVTLLKALPAADATAFRALLEKAGSPLEQAFLFKAVGAGYPVSDVQTFANSIHGWSNAQLLSTMNLADPIVDDGKQTGVLQQFHATCVPTTGQALRGEVDPIYALKVRSENTDIHLADENDPYAKNKNLATEQAAVLTGQGGVAEARSMGGSGVDWAKLDNVYNACSAQTGFAYKVVEFDKEPQVTMDQHLDQLAAQLSKGIPTPILVGVQWATKCHAMIALDVEGTGPQQRFLIHDPWGGDTTWVTRAQFDANQMGIPEFTTLGGIHLATPAPAVVPPGGVIS